MRLAVGLVVGAVVSLGAGCTDEEPAYNGPAIDSRVVTYYLPGTLQQQLDVLIVVDDTTAMAPYQTALAALPGGIAARLSDPMGSQCDFRVAVTTTDGTGTLRQPTATSDPYLARGLDVHFQVEENFTGEIVDVLGELVEVGASSTAIVQPLEAAKRALDTNPAVFRDDAYLGILTISASDDASAGTAVDYATSLKARRNDPLDIVLSGVYPAAASRLDDFHTQFPNRNSVADIAMTDFTDAFGLIGALIRSTLAAPCLEDRPIDVAPEIEGDQYDCDLHAYYDDGTTERIAICGGPADGPCLELAEDPVYCPYPGVLRWRVLGFPTRYVPTVRGQCVVK